MLSVRVVDISVHIRARTTRPAGCAFAIWLKDVSTSHSFDHGESERDSHGHFAPARLVQPVGDRIQEDRGAVESGFEDVDYKSGRVSRDSRVFARQQ